MRASETLQTWFACLLILVVVPTASPGLPAGIKPMPGERKHDTPIFSQSNASEDAVEAFLVTLQKAVAADDRPKVASMIRYPIVIRAGNRSVLFKTSAALIASYELIFTDPLKKIIAEAQRDSLFSNGQGYMIHDGELWFNEVGPRGYKIITFNPPVGEKQKDKPAAQPFRVHPKVFSLMESWGSDSEHPVVTEINLNAVAKDSNQFPPEGIKQDGEWIRCDTEDGRGFIRYKTLKTEVNKYTVECQNNGGGSLTTTAYIEFVVERRQLMKNGKPNSIRVLRVLAYTLK